MTCKLFFTRDNQKINKKEKVKAMQLPRQRFCWLKWLGGQSWRIFIL